MSKSHDLAWAAGFFDGEGYITIGRRSSSVNGKIYRHHYLRIGINHVAKEPINEMVRILGGSVEYQNINSVQGNRIPRTRWICNTKKAEEVLREMMPYFRNKNKAAEIAFEYLKTIGSCGKRLTPDIDELRENLRIKLRDINKID
jgi:hypothetical protein